MKPQDHQSFGDISPGIGRYNSQKDLSPFSKFLSSIQEQSPCIGKQFQKTLSFGPEELEIPLLTRFRDQSPNFEEQSEQKVEQLYPRITRQFIVQNQEEKVCKKLDFNQFNGSKSPISKGFQLFNSPMQKNLAITAKKVTSYNSPKMEMMFNELPTAQRAKWNPWNQAAKEKQQGAAQEDELQCSEPDFEEERRFHVSPKVKQTSKSPGQSDNEAARYESMSFSGQSSKPVGNKKYQYINLITLKKKPKESEQKITKNKIKSSTFDVNLTTRKTKRKQIAAPIIQQQPQKNVICNCKKSKCLKLYCDCFAAGQNCGKDCNCQGCSNNDDHLEERNLTIKQIVDRNPNAFRSKAENGNSEDDHLRHFKGCNCKKSNCLKKYCECYQIGVKCSELCKCEECKNYDQRHSRIKNHKIRNEDLYYKFETQRTKRTKQY